MLERVGDIELPPHVTPGGFDHAAVHAPAGRLYVAHTANDAVDVIDCRADTYLRSIPHLPGVAGALVAEAQDLVFTSNRGENTIAIVSSTRDETLARVKVGLRPNGLAYDPGRRLLLAANVGDPARPGSFTVSVVDVAGRAMIADVPVAGRTRWTVFDPERGRFYVNIADPPQIAIIDAARPERIAGAFSVPAAGPHGLDLDVATGRLFCACDGRALVVLDGASGDVLADAGLGGVPDVIFFNAALRHLYVAIGDPGVIEVFETDRMRRIETVTTGRGAHTLAFDSARDTVYAFLSDTHSAAVYRDRA